jgi:hypothetical protein
MTIGYSYHRIIRKMIVAFGDLFNQINLVRYDDNGQELEHFLVPILYGGKEKYVSRLEGDPNLDKKVQITLPVMSYEMTNMSYDAGRKLNTNQRIIYPGDASTTTLAVWNPVPFDFDFSLYLYVRNFEDSAQIIEKIIPYFAPDYTVSVNLIPEMNLVKQLPIIMKDITHDIDYEGNWESNVRTIIWTLNFTIKGYIYGAISEPKIIRTSITNIFDDNSLKNKNITATMSAGGNGNYKYNEIVYQGYSYETATATANVSNWLPATRQLQINKLNGHFVAGQNVIGSSTNSNWVVSYFSENSSNLVNITITPNPSNVILPNNYTYTTVITEYPNTL